MRISAAFSLKEKEEKEKNIFHMYKKESKQANRETGRMLLMLTAASDCCWLLATTLLTDKIGQAETISDSLNHLPRWFQEKTGDLKRTKNYPTTLISGLWERKQIKKHFVCLINEMMNHNTFKCMFYGGTVTSLFKLISPDTKTGTIKIRKLAFCTKSFNLAHPAE